MALPSLRRFAILGLSFATLPSIFLPVTAFATTFTWSSGSPANFNWSDPANWVGNAVPPSNLATTDLVFGNSGFSSTVITSPYSIHSLVFPVGTTSYTFSGSALTIGSGGITQGGAAAQTFSNAPVILGDDQTWSLANGSGQLSFGAGINLVGVTLTVDAASATGNTISADITGGGTANTTSLIKNGAGLLTLLGTSSYTGQTRVNAGTLAFSGTFSNLDRLYVVESGSATISGGSTLSFAANQGIFLAGSGGDIATMTVSGAGTVVNTYDISLGSGDAGTFLQSGGTVNVTQRITLGGSSRDNHGTYILNGGSLFSQEIYLGRANPFQVSLGTFSQSGGINTTDRLRISVGGPDPLIGDALGTYHLEGGILAVKAVDKPGPASADAIFNFRGGTLRARESTPTFFQGLTTANVRGSATANSGAVVDTNGFDVTISQPLVHSTISGDAAIDGGLTKTGPGTLTLSSASTYTGETMIINGTLSVTGSLTGAGNVGVGAGSTLAISGGSVSLASGKTLTVNGTGASPAAASLGPGLLSTGSAYVGLNGNASFAQTGGSFTTNGTTLFVGFNAGSNGTYSLSGGNLTTGNTLISDDANFSSFIQSGGTHATSNLTLGAFSASANGMFHLNGGILAANSVTRTSGTGVFNFQGGTLRAGQSTTTFFQGLTTANVRGSSAANSGAVVNTNGFNVTIAQPLVHSTIGGDAAIDGGLTKTGLGTLTLSGASTYTGATNITAGTLTVTGSLTGAGTVAVGAGSTLAIVGGSVSLANRSLFVGSTSGSPATASLGPGLLSTGLSYVGWTESAIFTQTDGSFTTNGSQLVLGTHTGANTTYSLSGGSLTTGHTAISFGANISSLTQSGGTHTTGPLTLGASSTSSEGTYHLNGGTLAVNSVTRTSGTGVFNFKGGNLRAGQSTDTFFQGLTTANVRGSSAANSGAVVNTNGFNVTIAQPLVHSTIGGDAAIDGGLTKTGLGTLTLSGASTYTGSTTVGAGTLALTGSISGSKGVSVPTGSTLTIAGSATLSPASGSSVEVIGGSLLNNGTETGLLHAGLGGVVRGTGTFGSLELTDGGVISPGNSPGTANFTGNVTFGAGSRYVFELNSVVANSGSQDFLDIDGFLSILSTPANKLTLAISTLNGANSPAPLTDFLASEPYTFNLATAVGGISGFNAAAVAVDATNFINNSMGGRFSIFAQGSSLMLQFTPVPEPGCLAMLVTSAALLGMRRKRRASVV